MNDFLQVKELRHFGVKGMHWGIRKYKNEDASRIRQPRQTYIDKDIVFVSGKIKYDEILDDNIKFELDNAIKANSKIIIGDAPGTDARVQEYLKEKQYKNVKIYTSDSDVRNNIGEWPVIKIVPDKDLAENKVRELKDIIMTNIATKAIAIMPENDRPDSAMSNNVNRLRSKGLEPVIFDYEKKKWIS